MVAQENLEAFLERVVYGHRVRILLHIWSYVYQSVEVLSAYTQKNLFSIAFRACNLAIEAVNIHDFVSWCWWEPFPFIKLNFKLFTPVATF